MEGRARFGGGAFRLLCALALLAVSVGLPSAAGAQTIVDRDARAAIGQQSLLNNILNQPASTGLFFPSDVARDPSVSNTRFFVADTFNSRVVGIECAGASCALPTGASATRVFGQPDFGSFAQNGGLSGGVGASVLNFPHGVAVDASGTLYVADTGNNRVLVYTNPWSDAAADIVIGQTSMSAQGSGSALNRLNAPQDVFVDASNALWVADTGNNRVLRFDAPLSNGKTASVRIGAAGAPSASTLSAPRGIFVDGSGRLYVADTGFSRVLSYPAPLVTGQSATTVFGHNGSFTSGGANNVGLGASSLALPEKIHVDASGRLWISDTGNNRVLEVDTPLTSQTANRVFGQADRNQVPTFATNTRDAPDGFESAAGLFAPQGLLTDAAGALWVCDHDNSRLLALDSPLGALPGAIIADRVLGKQRFVDPYANLPTAKRMNNPTGVAIDPRSPNRLWVADIGNSRVLGYDSTANLASDRAANLVLGQPSFSEGSPNANLNGPLQNAANAVASNASLFFPTGVAVDSHGGVYVADASNNRVLEFDDPFATGTTAERVFGQTSFSARNPSFPYGTATSLAMPSSVAVDASDDLWVADTLNHRVLRFAPGQPQTGGAANLILGQANFLSSTTPFPYSPGCAQNRMNAPLGVFAGPSGRLYVPDSSNNRVLVFSPGFSNGMNAGAVFGQADFTHCAANRGGAPSASTLSNPQGVLEDTAGNVYIADFGNNRLLVYHVPFAGGDFVADEVLGQPTFAATAVTSPGPDTLASPSSIAIDAAGRLFVADRENSRVLRYATNSGPEVVLDPISSPIVVGDFVELSGSGFTAGSVIQLFVATASGTQGFGPYTPTNWSAGFLVWNVDPSIPLGAGFATVQVVNTDESFITSNPESQLLIGAASRNIPSILGANGIALAPADPTIPVAYVPTNLMQGFTVTLHGSGFNNPKVNVFTSGSVGPITPTSVTATDLDFVLPMDAPTGPGSFQVVNSPYTGNVVSNAVTIPIGPPIGITSVTQSGQTVTVKGTGFSVFTVINLFNAQPGGVANLGGFDAFGNARVPLTFDSATQLRFTAPNTAVAGPAYVQALNPPFIPLTSTGNDPDGAFTIAP